MPAETKDYLRTQARRCRTLAAATLDENMKKKLSEMAVEYEAKAGEVHESEPGETEPE